MSYAFSMDVEDALPRFIITKDNMTCAVILPSLFHDYSGENPRFLHILFPLPVKRSK